MEKTKRMKLTLYQKLSTTLLLVFLLIVGAFIYIIQSFEAISRVQAEQKLHEELAEHLVHDNPLLSSGQHDYKALQNLFHSMMILGPNFEFYVLDKQGNILTYSAKPGEVKRKKVNLAPINAVLAGEQSYPIYADDPRSRDQKKIFSVAPILKDGQLTGYLYVILGGQIYDSILSNVKNNEQVQLLGVLALVSILFLLVLLLVSFQFFVSPIKRLTHQVSQLRLDKLDKKLAKIEDQANGKEVGELSHVFNQLIDQINRQFEQLSAVDKERRELLAHLSHDLRTPLASLQGFLQTIQLKKDTLTKQDWQQYIERCLKNAQSLKGFVDQIFELAHLESGEVTVSMESFPLADLLYDMVDKFSLVASNKNIRFEVELKQEDVKISTDIAKLERILTNLVENALRHTPSGGRICLGAQVDEELGQVSLVIKDSGTGINQDELPYLFEPRYRGKQAIDDDKRHIGLGLTITRKLVKLLGSEIYASNNPEGGANFRFGLPIQVNY